MMKFVGLIMFVVLWWLVTLLGVANPVFIPDPTAVFIKVFDLFSTQSFYYDIWGTTFRLMASLSISLLVGIPIGLALGNNKRLYDSVELLLDFFRSIPATALFPLAILFFGIGDLAKIGIVSFSCTLVLILQTYYGVSNTSRVRIDVFKMLKATKQQTFTRLLIFEALPHIFSGIRVIVSLSLVLVIVTEMFIGTDFGLGKRLIDAQSTYRVEELYAVIILVGMIGYGLNQLAAQLQQKLVHWGQVN